MKPAVSSNKWAIPAAALVGGFALWWYLHPFPWLGAIMAVLFGAFTFAILTTRRMEQLRRVLYIGIFAMVLVSLTVIITSLGLDSFLAWASLHEKAYYISGQTLGTLSYPCTREIPQVLLGRATYLTGVGLWQTNFPDNLKGFLLLMVPYFATAIVFGRGTCGWVCPFGGLNEVMVTGKKERWQLNFLKKADTTVGGSRYAGLKTWVKDIKYGMLVAVILLSIFFFPIVCAYCPVFWLSAMPVFWTIMVLLLIFAIILPFMTKRRWWCHICPLGATFALMDKISFFRVRIEKKKCSQCMDCVQECRMFALTPNLFGTFRKARGIFISLILIAILAWYIWFIVILAEKIAMMF
jgi:polyferredoxin